MMKLGTETGSLINHIQSTYQNSAPKVGEGATVLHWTDRHAYTVVSVSEDGKSCEILRDKAIRTDNFGMSDSQDYRYEKGSGNPIKLVFKRNAWRTEVVEIAFTKEFEKWIDENPQEFLAKRQANNWINNEFFDENGDFRIIEGKTRIKKSYPKINIRFGYRDEYYDYCF